MLRQVFVLFCLKIDTAPAGSAKCAEGMLTIIAEGGELSCADPPAVNHTHWVASAADSNDDNANVEACFTSYCQSTYVRNYLVDLCKNKGTDNCDSLSYHSILSSYKFSGTIDYDDGAAQKSGEKTGSRFTQSFQNGNAKEPDSTDYKKTVTKQDAYTWEFTAGRSLTASIETSVSADIPEIAKVGVKAGYKSTISFQERNAHTSTNTQTWELNQHIVEEPNSCTRACVLESEGTATVPFTMTGTFSGDLKKYYSGARDTDGFMCCYLREGGGSDCGGGSGWALMNSPGAAVRGGTCPGFGSKGYDATYVSHGNFKASMDFDVRVKTIKGPYNDCPSVDECDKMGTSYSDLKFVV